MPAIGLCTLFCDLYEMLCFICKYKPQKKYESSFVVIYSNLLFSSEILNPLFVEVGPTNLNTAVQVSVTSMQIG